jgi:hypothetical protein
MLARLFKASFLFAAELERFLLKTHRIYATLIGGPDNGRKTQVFGANYRRLIANKFSDLPGKWVEAHYKWAQTDSGEFVGIFTGIYNRQGELLREAANCA